MDLNNKKIHIGIIGYGGHTRDKFTETIKKYLDENSKNRCESSLENIEKRRTLKPNK